MTRAERASGRGLRSADLVVVLGDQLSLDGAALARADRTRDVVVMVEAAGEATQVWSHRARIAMFVAAMRHFAEELRAAGFASTTGGPASTRRWLTRLARRDRLAPPFRRRRVRAGRVARAATLQQACDDLVGRSSSSPTRISCAPGDEFARWAKTASRCAWSRSIGGCAEPRRADGRRRAGVGTLELRRRQSQGFRREGPRPRPAVPSFAPDAITRDAIADVARAFPGTRDRSPPSHGR